MTVLFNLSMPSNAHAGIMQWYAATHILNYYTQLTGGRGNANRQVVTSTITSLHVTLLLDEK
jgi:hypothetical protein